MSYKPKASLANANPAIIIGEDKLEAFASLRADKDVLDRIKKNAAMINTRTLKDETNSRNT